MSVRPVLALVMTAFFFAPVLSEDGVPETPKLNLDARLFLSVNGVRCGFLDGASTVISDLPVIPGFFYLYSTGFGYFRDDDEALRFGEIGLTVSASVVAVNQTIKLFVKRERPKFAVPGAEGNYSHGFTARLLPSEVWSFPSQSASLAMSTAVVFGYAYPRLDKYFFTLAVLNGWARVYRAAHYPGDVLAGEVLGACVTWGVLALFRRYGGEAYDIRKNPPRIPLLSVEKRF